MPDLPSPLESHPHRIVVDVYPSPVADHEPIADYPSRDGFEEFLIERFTPEAQPTPGGRIFVPGEPQTVTRFERNGWLITPKLALIGTLVLAGSANLLLNAGDFGKAGHDGVELAQDQKDHVEDYFHIGQTCRTVDEGPTSSEKTTKHFETFVQLENVGSSEPSPSGVRQLVDNLLANQKEGKVVDINFVGVASDEWRSKQPGLGLGVADKENAEQLAPERLVTFLTAVHQEGDKRGLDLAKLKVSYSEVVLASDTIVDIESNVGKFGYRSLDQVLAIYNTTPDQLPPSFEKLLDVHIGSNRGLRVSENIDITKTIEHKTVTDKKCNPDGSPEKHHDYDWRVLPLLVPPIPKLRRKLVEKVRGTFVDVPPELPDPEFLKLYPQAQTAVNVLGREAWAYARKYQNLLRETDRIGGVYSLDYLDEDGETRRLRAMFVDHEPTPDTVQMLASLLQTISQMQGGRVGKELDMITVFPSENAGMHGDAKKVGLGLDIQRDSSVQGVAYPNLRLVEIQMPTTPTDAEINSFNGAKYVLAHEIAGHFTDLTEEQNIMNLIANIGGVPIYSMNDRFLDSAKTDFDRVTANEAGADTRTLWQKILRRPYDTQLRWHIKRGTQMTSGDIEPRSDIVSTKDVRLTESIYVRIGRFMSRYARTNAAEHYAEAAANIATGIGAPFDEEPEARANKVQARHGYADTYSASPTMHKLITDRWGSDSSADFAKFPSQASASKEWKHRYDNLSNSDLAGLADEARNTPLPDESDLLWIVTGSRIRK